VGEQTAVARQWPTSSKAAQASRWNKVAGIHVINRVDKLETGDIQAL
jgi:hypothetical protein